MLKRDDRPCGDNSGVVRTGDPLRGPPVRTPLKFSSCVRVSIARPMQGPYNLLIFSHAAELE